ncbi:timeless isoform X2 [Rhodnius prolixus]
MEWLTTNSQMHNAFAPLGSQRGKNYVVNEECQNTLEEILNKLSLEDRTLHTFRRTIGFSQVIKKDLLPLLINVKEDRKIIGTTIRILSNLTTPVECLLPIDVMSKTDAGRNTILELRWLLESCKETFLDPRTTRCVVNHIKEVVSKSENWTSSDVETLNDSLTLLRNILHIPVTRLSTSGATHQNQILWNLFAQNIDKVLIDLMSDHLKGEWRLTVVQLIALLYKDQHVPTLEKLLQQWFEASVLSESSEDNESNTSPPERGSGDSSSMITSDPTSDSSDNSGTDRNNETEFKGQKTVHNSTKKVQNVRKQSSKHGNQQTKKQEPSDIKSQKGDGVSKGKTEDNKMECGSSENSDCGYGTQVENQESVSSTSSNDGRNRGTKPIHHKPSNKTHKNRYTNGKPSLTPQEKEELKRKKLIRRCRTNVVNMKALLHHTPTDEDISHLLKEFTVDFLLKGYGSLVSDLREQLMFNVQAQSFIDSSHFFWLITYFLKFAVLLELDLQHISSVLTFDVVSFITYEGVALCEQFELSKLQSEFDMTPCLRKIHLVVTAIRELVQTINAYKKIKHLNKEDKANLSKIQRQMSATEDLRCLFVLLLRQFNPNIHSKQYLQDVIVTNHLLLSFIESCHSPNTAALLQTHMQQFVAVDMMTQYGILLEGFEENGQYVNDCIFTMMHHVAGDLEHVSALFQPNILKIFSRIWETDFELCDDWIDLVEYVIHKFINIPRGLPLLSEKQDSIDNRGPVTHAHGWSQEDCDNLYWYYVQSANNSDPVGDVVNLYSKNGVTNKTRIGVIEQLLKQDVITGNQYNDLMKKEPLSVTSIQPTQHAEHSTQSKDEVEILRDHLIKDGKINFITWIQKVLLETCNAKLNIKKNRNECLTEPLPYYCALLQESTPIVAWSFEQCNIMHSQAFLLLLHKLGLLLPVDAGKVFARIPHSWAPDILFNIACKLGPIQQEWMKFSVEDISEDLATFACRDSVVQQQNFTSATQHSPLYISSTPR